MDTKIIDLIKTFIPEYVKPKEYKGGIYIIYNITSGKYYIGSSKNWTKRVKDHFLDLSKGHGVNKHFQNAFNKYGQNSFVYSLIEGIEIYSKDVFLSKENYWISLLDATHKGYNISEATFGGDTRTYHPLKNEINRKTSNTLIVQIQNLSDKEYAIRFGIGVKRKPYPLSFSEKVSERKKGRKHHFYGRHLSNEHKTKLSEKFLGDKNPEAKSYLIEGRYYSSRKEAISVLGISAPTLRKRCNSDDVKWHEWTCLGLTKDLRK